MLPEMRAAAPRPGSRLEIEGLGPLGLGWRLGLENVGIIWVLGFRVLGAGLG